MQCLRERLQVIRGSHTIIELVDVLYPVAMVRIAVHRAWTIPILLRWGDPNSSEASVLDVIQISGNPVNAVSSVSDNTL